ncbi:MAG: hypothetical protein V8T19_03095 [Senegalimassilia anaerobia]
MVGEVLENNLGFPLLRRCKRCDFSHKGLRHGIHRSQQNTEHGARSRDVIVCAMRGNRRPEGANQVDKSMGFQAGESNASKIQGVKPGVLQQRIAAWMSRGEGAIEGGIMGHKLRITNELGELRKRFFRRRSVGNVLVMNIGQMRNIFRNRLSGVYERYEPIDNLALIHAGCRNLRQLIVIEREAGCLGVYNDDIAVKLTVIAFFRSISKRCIAIDDRLRGSITDIREQITTHGIFLISHMDASMFASITL